MGGPKSPIRTSVVHTKKTALDKFKKVQMEELNANTLFQSKVNTSEVWKCIFGFGKVTIQGGANVELGGYSPHREVENHFVGASGNYLTLKTMF